MTTRPIRAVDAVTRLVGGDVVTSASLLERGPAGPPGQDAGSGFTKTASVALSGHRVVRPVSAAEVAYCDALTLGHASSALGITTGAALAGDPVTVIAGGELAEPSWSWTPGLPIFCGPNGTLTQTASPAWAWSRVVAFASSPTSIVVALEAAIVLAP